LRQGYGRERIVAGTQRLLGGGSRIYSVMTTATSPVLPAPSAGGKALRISLWVAQILLAGMFFLAGGNKLGGNPEMVGLFDAIGIGQWFRYLTGGLEVLGGILLLVPRLSGVGATLLVPVMLGAVVTHVGLLHNSPGVPLALLLALLFVAWGRRAQVAALVRRVLG
jgi:putative oxidoreductase